MRLLARQACRRHEPPRHEALALGIQLRRAPVRQVVVPLLDLLRRVVGEERSVELGLAVGPVEVVADVGRRRMRRVRVTMAAGVDGRAAAAAPRSGA